MKPKYKTKNHQNVPKSPKRQNKAYKAANIKPALVQINPGKRTCNLGPDLSPRKTSKRRKVAFWVVTTSLFKN